VIFGCVSWKRFINYKKTMGQLSSYCQHLALEKQQKVTVAGQKALTPSDNRSTT
jgi:hypothetical protein